MENYLSIMNDDTEQFEKPTKTLFITASEYAVILLCCCLPNNSKHTQKQRHESIVQSFIFQGNFVLHKTKLTGL